MDPSQLPSPSCFVFPGGSDTMRLPAYRSAYLGRYHPYPRGGPRPSRDTDFNINDTSVHVPYDGPRLDWHLPIVSQEEVVEKSLVKLNEVVSNDEGARARRLSLSTLVIDLALSITRHLRILQSAQKEGAAFELIL